MEPCENVFNMSLSCINSTLDTLLLSTITTHTRESDNLSMKWWIQMAWCSIFVFMIFTATGGNTIVIWIVLAHKRMRTVTNYFLVNLSTADLMLSTLNCFFNFIYMLQGNWRFGSWYCTANNFIANMTVAASVFTLTAISCDRYLAIVHPLKPRMSKVFSIFVIFLIWIFSMLLAIPCLLYSTTVTYRGKRTACILIWPDGQPTISQMDFLYQVIFLVITYCVPMVLMSCCYTCMGRVLWGSKSIGEKTQRQADAIQSKRKVVKMFIFIVFVFGICWLPYHAYFIYTHFDRKVLYSKYVQHVYLAFYWFAMANAMVNPLIYYWMNTRFRRYFRRAICCWRILIDRNWQDSMDSPTNNGQSFMKSGLSRRSTRGGTERMNTLSTRIYFDRQHQQKQQSSQQQKDEQQDRRKADEGTIVSNGSMRKQRHSVAATEL